METRPEQGRFTRLTAEASMKWAAERPRGLYDLSGARSWLGRSERRGAPRPDGRGGSLVHVRVRQPSRISNLKSTSPPAGRVAPQGTT
jgi:hypothetical protein